MTRTRELAARVGHKVGIDPISAATLLSALVQAWLACKGVEPTPQGLRAYAKDWPAVFRITCRRQARRHDVPREQLEWLVDEIFERVAGKDAEPIDTLAAVFAEAQTKREDDTGEWNPPHTP